MTQENKELLFKDLCARLPYGVIVETPKGKGHVCDINLTIFGYEFGVNVNLTIRDNFSISYVKPYLFPLSSMTDEQKKEISEIYNYHNYGLYIEISNHSEGYWDNDTSCNLQDYLWLEDWFNKNHFDYRGLIEKGLAIDATGLNIY